MKRLFSIAIAAGSLFLSAASSSLAADRIIVATFGDTNNAYEAAKAIKDLKEAGGTEFKLKTGVMIAKDQNGNVSVLARISHTTNPPTVIGDLKRLAGAILDSRRALDCGKSRRASLDAKIARAACREGRAELTWRFHDRRCQRTGVDQVVSSAPQRARCTVAKISL